jgi:predicted pyridoxine 5'-phosphate oxidase superfamily flavin-nucleotide-binding protein
VQIADRATFLMPDWRGNNRMDSLRNILADGLSA